MARAFTPGLQVSAEKTVSKLRELPVAGEILVSVGDQVQADQIVARAELPGDMYILRLPERMGLEVFEVLHGLQVEVGDSVRADQVLCRHSGLFGLLKTTFRSPEEGTIELIARRTGHIGLRLAPTSIEVDAFISGTVTDVVEGKSLTIESHAAFIQGIFGIGGERRGVLKLLDVPSEALIEDSDIPQDCSGNILIGGAAPSYEALKLAADRGAVGFVVGAIDDQVLARYLGYDLGIALTGDEEVPMTVIVTEGFGLLPIAHRTMKVLERFAGSSASINGATQVRAGALRPEIIISHSEHSSSGSDSFDLSLEIGASIRIIRYPHFGQRAVVSDLPSELEKIDTGAYTRVLVAKLKDGSEVRVPRANVELV